MPGVHTVRGLVDSAGLGPTLMHEHIFIMSPEHVESYGTGTWWDEDRRVDDAVEKLRRLASSGIRTIVDMTVLGLGRSIPRIQRVAARVPELNIVVSTGLYTLDAVPLQYSLRGPGLRVDVPEPMTTDFCRDLQEGIGGTGVRAAMLKCVIDEEGLTPGVRRVAQAVAQAHLRTGAPITVHTNAAERTGLPATRFFASAGADMSKVVIGHAGDSADLDYLMRLADSGATLGMDRFGLDSYLSTAERVATIAALCDRGYADRMVLSHDTACFMDYYGEHWEFVLGIFPEWRYDHVPGNVLPALAQAGVSEPQIATMMVDNPRRLLSSGP